MTNTEKYYYIQEKTGMSVVGISIDKINHYIKMLKDPFPLLESDLIDVIQSDIYNTKLYSIR